MSAQPATGLDLLRKQFPANQVGKLPKESRAQIDERKADRSAGVACRVCGSWHHKNAVHLDFIGHAALTDRLLDADPNWSWEPLAFDEQGLPRADKTGGLWIKLTVCGVMRLGYGCADGKSGGDAVKEVIGDALRNAAMRFGAALDLWHKGDLHAPDTEADGGTQDDAPEVIAPQGYTQWVEGIEDVVPEGLDALKAAWVKSQPAFRTHLTTTDNARWERMKTAAAQVAVKVPA